MLQLECPWCGLRDETEFSFGGESHIIRPPQPEQRSDAEWVKYLHIRENPKGWHRERWQHRFGCRQWFNVIRHTVTHEVHCSYTMEQPQPELPMPNAIAAQPGESGRVG